MMPSNGSPTPKGVGGPTPPLVSRGSEEEWKMKIPTGGPPTLVGEREASAPTEGRMELTRNREEDEEPPPPGREEKRTEEERREASRTDQKNRHDGPTRAGNYAC